MTPATMTSRHQPQFDAMYATLFPFSMTFSRAAAEAAAAAALGGVYVIGTCTGLKEGKLSPADTAWASDE